MEFLIILCITLAARAKAGIASHHFSPYEAEIFWSSPYRGLRGRDEIKSDRDTSFLSIDEKPVDSPVKILHITDTHISIDDPEPPRTSRMFNAFSHTTDHETHQPTSPKDEFVTLLRHAKETKVDLIAIGGDLVNYPSSTTVNWVLNQLHEVAGGIPFIYTAGNHDWHEEGVLADKRYDSSRLFQLNATLRPLFELSATARDMVPGSPRGLLYGKTSVRGVDVLFVDNSNYQITQDQLDYIKSHLETNSKSPAVLLTHMPLKLDGAPPLQPKYVCGHPDWGADSDDLYNVEGRPRWPEDGNAASTLAFIDLVRQHSAPAGRLVAMLTGHVHKDFSTKLQDGTLPNAANLTALVCPLNREGCQMSPAATSGFAKAEGAVQYTTLDGAEGGYRLLKVRH